LIQRGGVVSVVENVLGEGVFLHCDVDKMYQSLLIVLRSKGIVLTYSDKP